MAFLDETVDTTTPYNVALSANYRRSFAYITVKDRLPVILTQVIDHLSRHKEHLIQYYGEEAKEDMKIVIGYFSKLKNELQTNKPLQALTSSGTDVTTWNAYLQECAASEGSRPRWFSSPWLYVECYLYRRFQEAFELSESLQMFDPFCKQKETALFNSMETVKILAENVLHTLTRVNELNQDEIKREFLKLVHVCLWGNRCDLSISGGKDVVLTEDPFCKIDELSDFILVDNSNKIWDALTYNSNPENAVVDIVLDNAGYELFTDLCLADYLCSFSLVSKVRFHAKKMPWFVSDVLLSDFSWVLQTVASKLPALASRWQAYLDADKWTVEAEDFWTFPHGYSQMEVTDPELYGVLSQAVLVIFKGDLNYRKLTGDMNWEPTCPFTEALRGFSPTALVALRTVKADVICGLAPGQAETVEAKSPNWLVSGEYALIQFSE